MVSLLQLNGLTLRGKSNELGDHGSRCGPRHPHQVRGHAFRAESRTTRRYLTSRTPNRTIPQRRVLMKRVAFQPCELEIATLHFDPRLLNTVLPPETHRAGSKQNEKTTNQ